MSLIGTSQVVYYSSQMNRNISMYPFASEHTEQPQCSENFSVQPSSDVPEVSISQNYQVTDG